MCGLVYFILVFYGLVDLLVYVILEIFLNVMYHKL